MVFEYQCGHHHHPHVSCLLEAFSLPPPPMDGDSVAFTALTCPSLSPHSCKMGMMGREIS